MSKQLRINIALEGIKPMIWRTFTVRDTATFEELHEIIQAVMGWESCHMFEFKIGDVTIQVDEEEN